MPYKSTDGWRTRWNTPEKREHRLAVQRAYNKRRSVDINDRLKAKRNTPEGWANMRAADRKYREKHPYKWRAAQLQKRYGLTLDQYQQMAAHQHGRCAICDTVPQGKGKKSGTLHVDHDHATGVTRGLLCDRCNRAIGLFGDSSIVLTKAAMYLACHKKVRREA